MAPISLCYKFTNSSRARKFVVTVIHNPWFDYIIITCILLNSICMGAYDYYDEHKCAYDHSNSGGCPYSEMNQRNQILTIIGGIFGIIFIIEAALKIFALGFVFHEMCYLRSGWNILDFVIVMAFVIEIVNLPIDLRVLRTLRILRPLKAAKTSPSLRKQITALIASIQGVFNVCIFVFFMVLLFAIVGLHWFSGNINYTCRVGEPPVSGMGSWTKYSDFSGDS